MTHMGMAFTCMKNSTKSTIPVSVKRYQQSQESDAVKRIRISLDRQVLPLMVFVWLKWRWMLSQITIFPFYSQISKMCVVPFCVSRPKIPTKICVKRTGNPGRPGNACKSCKLRSEVPTCRSAKGNPWTLPSQQVVAPSISRWWQLKYDSLRIQVCPKKGINPTILLWGWDSDHQTYSREGYGSLGCHPYLWRMNPF